jgi:hypothetical protein
MGGDLRHLDAPTLALLTNREVLAVNQHSPDNRPHFIADNTRIWSARPADGHGRYVALFNTGKDAREATIPLRDLGLAGQQPVRDLWQQQGLAPAEQRFTRILPSHGAGLYRIG